MTVGESQRVKVVRCHSSSSLVVRCGVEMKAEEQNEFGANFEALVSECMRVGTILSTSDYVQSYSKPPENLTTSDLALQATLGTCRKAKRNQVSFEARSACASRRKYSRAPGTSSASFSATPISSATKPVPCRYEERSATDSKAERARRRSETHPVCSRVFADVAE